MSPRRTLENAQVELAMRQGVLDALERELADVAEKLQRLAGQVAEAEEARDEAAREVAKVKRERPGLAALRVVA